MMLTDGQHDSLLRELGSIHLAYERLRCRHREAMAVLDDLVATYEAYEIGGRRLKYLGHNVKTPESETLLALQCFVTGPYDANHPHPS